MPKKKSQKPDAERNQLQGVGRYLERLTNPRNVFFLGVVRGVGAAVGATIVAGILFWFLSRIYSTVEDIPVLNDFVQSIKQAIGNNN